MLPECNREVNTFHFVEYFIIEEVWSKECCLISSLCILLISRIVVGKIVSARWSPLFSSNQGFIEDLFGIYLNKSSVSVISNSSTIVCLSNQILNSLPRNRRALIISVSQFTILDSTKINSKQIFAHLVVRIVESVRNIPSKSLKLFTFNQN